MPWHAAFATISRTFNDQNWRSVQSRPSIPYVCATYIMLLRQQTTAYSRRQNVIGNMSPVYNSKTYIPDIELHGQFNRMLLSKHDAKLHVDCRRQSSWDPPSLSRVHRRVLKLQQRGFQRSFINLVTFLAHCLCVDYWEGGNVWGMCCLSTLNY